MSLVLFLSLSCNSNDDNNNVGFVPQTITPSLIGKGELFVPYNNINVQQNINITNQSDWNNFEIIAIFDNVKPTGGNSVDITSIIENVDNISITIQRLQSGDATVVTQPFHIVKVPISSKPLIYN